MEIGVCTFFTLKNDVENHHKMWSESMPLLIVFRVIFGKNHMGAEYLVACRLFFVFVRFLERLTLDLLAPAQSKRSFSILDLLPKMCTSGTPFRDILESFGHHLPPLKDM